MSEGDRSLASQLRRRWAGRRFREAQIITGSTDDNGALLRWLHDEFGVRRALVVVDENRSGFLAKKIPALPLKVEVRHLPGSAPVHAKFLWFDGPEGAAAVMGSANCSAAGWMLPPASGGNVEAVVAYDRARPSQFRHVLELFESNELAPVRLKVSKAAAQAERREAAIPAVAEVLWDEPSGEVRVSFHAGSEEISAVSLVAKGERIVMRSLDPFGLMWAAEVPQLLGEPETVFIDLEIKTQDGAIHHVRRWDALMNAQEKDRPLYDVGDLLWNPKPGWAEVCEEIQWGYSTDAYLHMRADVKRVSSKFFLNVTKAAGRDGKIADNLEKLSVTI